MTMILSVVLVAIIGFSSKASVQAITCNVKIMAYGATSTKNVCPEGSVVINEKTVWTGKWCTDNLLIRNRGVNVLILDTETCGVSDGRNFDTWADNDAAGDLANYISYLAPGKVIIGVTGDEPTRKLADAKRQLRVAGVDVDDVASSGSFAFVIQIGSPEKTIFAKTLKPTVALVTQLTVAVTEDAVGEVSIVRA